MSRVDLQKKRTCRSCNAEQVVVFFENDQTPVNCGFLASTYNAALNADKGKIELGHCNHCGLIQNLKFDVDIIDFRPGYQVSLTHSPAFQAYQTELIDRLSRSYELSGKNILEIGCGAGEFLIELCKKSGASGVGIDPTANPEAACELPNGSVKFVRDWFGRRHVALRPDFICSLSVLEDIEDVNSFLQLARKVANANRCPVYFEVFNGYRAFQGDEVWSVHYEQCNYFSLTSLISAFEFAGFSIHKAGTCYSGDQYLFVEATAKECDQTDEQIQADNQSNRLLEDFNQTFQQKQRMWEERLQKLAESKKKVCLWGSGGKGITFLNSIKNNQLIEFVVDINPSRQELFIPGTGHVILSPHDLTRLKPDVVIITNPIYRNEIRSQLNDLGLNPQMLVS